MVAIDVDSNGAYPAARWLGAILRLVLGDGLAGDAPESEIP